MKDILIFSLFMLPGFALGTFSCSNPNGSWKQLGQHYYWVTGSKMNYDDAKTECENVQGGQLAEIMDKSTLLLMHNELHTIGGGNTFDSFGRLYEAFFSSNPCQ